MLYLLNLRKHSNQVELDQFFTAINDNNEATQLVTKSAFFQARKQLSPTAFIELNHQLIDTIYHSGHQYATWKGFRLCAIDGSVIRLP
ncbi:MAG: IS4/IS5 family transposase, partial [Gammaproteobacteria bacterium]